jgi:hypothetical protein
MRKSGFVVMALCLLLTCQPVGAQLNTDQEKRLKQLEEREKAQQIWELKNNEMQQDVKEPESSERPKQIPTTVKSDYVDASSDGIPGRYQAIRMDSNAIFILDTQKGHLWVWVNQKDNTGQPAEFLFYQGRVVPGSKMGEIIDRTYNK